MVDYGHIPLSEKSNSFPEIILEENVNFFKLFSFWLLVEDRRPDLTTDQARVVLGYKYKIQIRVKLLWKKYSLVFKTLNIGFISINGKEVI
jgi:hypothetical protein